MKNTNKKNYVIGIDLGGTNVRSAILDRDCSIINQLRKLTPAHEGFLAILKSLKKTISVLIKSHVKMSEIVGIGVASAGFVDYKSGVILYAANLPNWQDVPVKSILEKEYKIPVFVDHDVKMAAWGEWIYGAGRGVESLIYITIGTGIGMAMINRGKLYRGYGMRSGCFGHMFIDKSYGKDGYIEKLAAGRAVADRAREKISQGKVSLINDLVQGNTEAIDAKIVFKAARQGDNVATEIVKEIAEIIGIGVANAVLLLNPQLVIIGGGISQAGEILFIPLKKAVQFFTRNLCEVKVVPAKLGEEAGIIGMAQFVWDSLL